MVVMVKVISGHEGLKGAGQRITYGNLRDYIHGEIGQDQMHEMVRFLLV